MIVILVFTSLVTPGAAIASTWTTTTPSRATGYTYMTLADMESSLYALEGQYPSLMDVDTLQNMYGLPNCTGGYDIQLVKITNTQVGGEKPQVLLIGGHHGDEPVAVMTPYYLIVHLLDSYESDPYIRNLVDTREIYVVPCLNPYGYVHNQRLNGDGEDINRDYPYGVMDNTLSTVEAQGIFHLTETHAFVSAISWHSGRELIGYSWGATSRDTPTDEAPDDQAFSLVAQALSRAGGPWNNYYTYGRMNQLPNLMTDAAWEDWAYAAAWDAAVTQPNGTNPGCRTLSFLVEISTDKSPTVDRLGGADGIASPGGADDGYIPKNIRMGVKLIDMVEPYIEPAATLPSPDTVGGGDAIPLEWWVNGSTGVNSTSALLLRDNTTIATYTGSYVSENRFQATVILPDEPGNYSIVLEASTDTTLLQQSSPVPDVAPRSFFVNMRTNASWETTVGGAHLHGRLTWSENILDITLVPEQPPEPVISLSMDRISSPWNEGVAGKLSWNVTLDSISYGSFTSSRAIVIRDPLIPTSYLWMGHNNSLPDATTINDDGTTTLGFTDTVRLDRAGSFRCYCEAVVSGKACSSSMRTLNVLPMVDLELSPNSLSAGASVTATWNAGVHDRGKILSSWMDWWGSGPLGNISMDTDATYPVSRTVDLPFESGGFFFQAGFEVSLEGVHYNVTSLMMTVQLATALRSDAPTFRLYRDPVTRLPSGEPRYLDITGMKVVSSERGVGAITEDEAEMAIYEIHFRSNSTLATRGDLEYNDSLGWHMEKIFLGDLPAGSYYVICIISTEKGLVSTDRGHSPSINISARASPAKRSSALSAAFVVLSLLLLCSSVAFIVVTYRNGRRLDRDEIPRTGRPHVIKKAIHPGGAKKKSPKRAVPEEIKPKKRTTRHHEQTGKGGPGKKERGKHGKDGHRNNATAADDGPGRTSPAEKRRIRRGH